MNLLLALLCVLAQDGTPEQKLQYRLTRAYGQTDTLDPSLLASAKSSSSFAVRYIGLLVQIQETLAKGGGFEATYQKLLAASADGGPRGGAEHLKALAASFKAAVYCRDCTNGKVVCGQCQGKKRTEVKCFACEGKGRVGAPGAVDKSAVTMKCRNCDGKAVFRDARCPGCSGTGSVDCKSCLGSPWHDRPCTVKECRNGRVPCSQCKGKGKVEVPCPSCQGKGRVGAPGAIDPTQVTQRCNDCDAKGVLKEKQPCPSCDGSAIGIGWQRCTACKSDTPKAPVAALSAVFDTDPCSACAGKGWPAGACPSCLGLGVRIKPASNPARLLD